MELPENQVVYDPVIQIGPLIGETAAVQVEDAQGGQQQRILGERSDVFMPLHVGDHGCRGCLRLTFGLFFNGSEPATDERVYLVPVQRINIVEMIAETLGGFAGDPVATSREQEYVLLVGVMKIRGFFH